MILRLTAIGLVISLASCQDPKQAALGRAEVVKFCPDGTAIGRDPATGRLLWSNWTGSGFVAASVTADRVCA